MSNMEYFLWKSYPFFSYIILFLFYFFCGWFVSCDLLFDGFIHISLHFSGFVLWHSWQWHHNGHHSVSYHQPHHCLLNRLFRCRTKKTSKLRVTGLCVGNSPVTGKFPAQMASNTENVSIWWWHHVLFLPQSYLTYWGWVMHICFGKLTIIGSDKGLLSGWFQAIIWTNAGIL